MKHANVALFVPHNGCPHQCSFCNQRSITGQAAQPTPDDVHQAARAALARLGERAQDAELAFFGGSFTAVEPAYMRSLLEAANVYIKEGAFSGIRISTRPDAVPKETLALLKRYHVTAIELGAQSMEDSVLRANGRGHTAGDVREAARRIKDDGFSLGLQMMTGLNGSTPALDYKTGEALASLTPDTVRIYPTVVMRGTHLAELWQRGEYLPPDAEESIPLCAKLLDLFEKKDIRVIRLGLHDTPELRRDCLAGAFHPAFRELCEGERFLAAAEKTLLSEKVPKGAAELRVHPSNLSKMAGQKRRNLLALEALGWRITLCPEPKAPKQGIWVAAQPAAPYKE